MVGLAKVGYTNPGMALDAALELGIEKTGEVVGGATFETALLLAPAPKGAQVVKEGRCVAPG